ncbi:MAG: hypothetical protein WAK34_16465 [Rhodoplanes sp.]
MSEKRCALIENGVVVNVILADPGTYVPPAGMTLRDVEGLQVNIGDDWDGAQFIDNRVRAPEPPRLVLKSLIVQRLIDDEKIAAANAALEADPAKKARWYAADHPAIRADDADAIAFLQAIGADPAAILAP